MVFLLYLTVFALAFLLRYHSLKGARLDLHVDPEGRSYYETQRYTKKSRALAKVLIGVPTEQRLFFKIVPESFLLRIIKAIGAAEEYQIGEEAVDSRLLFISSDPYLFDDIMQQEPVRDALRVLMETPYQSSLRAFNHRLWLEVSGVSPDWLSQNRQRSLRALSEIADAASKHIQMTSADNARRSYALRALVFMALHSALLIGGILGVIAYGMSNSHILGATHLVFSSITMVPLFAGIWFLVMLAALRRSMWLVTALGDFILVGLVGMMLSVPLIMQEINRHLPQSTSQIESVPLVKKTCALHCLRHPRWGKGRVKRQIVPMAEADCRPGWRDVRAEEIRAQHYTCENSVSFKYKLYFSPWRKEQSGLYSMDVSPNLFDAGEPGDLYDFTVYTGALGYTWINKDEVRRSPDGGR